MFLACRILKHTAVEIITKNYFTYSLSSLLIFSLSLSLSLSLSHTHTPEEADVVAVSGKAAGPVAVARSDAFPPDLGHYVALPA